MQSLLAEAQQRITDAGFIIDYLEIKTDTLDLLANDTAIFNAENNNLMILVAAWLGRARLLDNQLVTVDQSL